MSKSGKHGPAPGNVPSHTFKKRVEKRRKKNKIAKKSRRESR